MKLIEVVVLLGAHCVSPVQQADAVTEVGKVQCAVMVEQDTGTGRVTVTPREATARPEVAEVLNRIAAGSAAGAAPDTMIEPAWAPPASQQNAPPAKPLSGFKPEAAASAPAPSAGQEAEPPVVAKPGPAPVKKPAAEKKKAAAKTKSAKRSANQCKGGASPQWYTTDEGKKRYRCVRAD